MARRAVAEMRARDSAGVNQVAPERLQQCLDE